MSKPAHIVLDIETLGTGHKCIVTHIGAVKFDPFDPDVPEQYFYKQLDYMQQQKAGRVLDVPTFIWWTQQNEGARNEHKNVGEDVQLSLEAFKEFCGTNCIIWGNGNVFDNAIVRNLCADFNVQYPTDYKRDLDFRTVVLLAQQKNNEFKVEHPAEMVSHHALEDAKNEARNFRRAVELLGLVKQSTPEDLDETQLYERCRVLGAEICKLNPDKQVTVTKWIRDNFNGARLAELDKDNLLKTYQYLKTERAKITT